MAVIGGAEAGMADAVVDGLSGGQTIRYRLFGVLERRIVLSEEQVAHFISKLKEEWTKYGNFVIGGVSSRRCCGSPALMFYQLEQVPGFRQQRRERGYGCSVCGRFWR
jgi:hypothetical protein